MNDEELYNAIVKEARVTNNHYDGFYVGKDTLLYKFVAQQAEAVGMSMDKINISVAHNDNFLGASLYHYDDGSKNIFLSKHLISAGGNLASLAGAVKHELAHAKQGKYIANNNMLFSSLGLYSYGKIEECGADFVAGKDMSEVLTNILVNKFPKQYRQATTHPSHRDRIKASLIKSYIEEDAGITLDKNDVSIKANCEFTITNPEKSKLVSPELMVEAGKKAENSLVSIDKIAATKLFEKQQKEALEKPPEPPPAPRVQFRR